MTHKKKKEGTWLYKPIKEALEKKFKDQFGNCYLDITYRGRFSERLMNAIPRANDVTFFFMGRRKAPDITGFIEVEEIIQSDMAVMIGNKKAKTSVKWPEFIVVEVKDREISLKDVCQVRNYALIFRTGYAFLMSPKPIPDQIKRLARTTNLLEVGYDWILSPLKKQSAVTMVQFDIENPHSIFDYRWFPDNPFSL